MPPATDDRGRLPNPPSAVVLDDPAARCEAEVLLPFPSWAPTRPFG